MTASGFKVFQVNRIHEAVHAGPAEADDDKPGSVRWLLSLMARGIT